MIKGRESIIAQVNIIVQIFLTLVCFCLAAWLTNEYISPVKISYKLYKIILFILLLQSYLTYDYFGFGKMLRIKMYVTIFLEYLWAITIGFVIFVLILDFVGINIPYKVLLIYFVLELFVLYTYKYISFRILKLLRSSGRNIRTVMIIADNDSEAFIDKLIATKDWGYKIYAICTSSPQIMLKYGINYTVLPEPDRLSHLIDERTIDEVMYCKSDFNQDKIKDHIYDCSEVGVVFRMHSEFLRFVSLRSEVAYYNQVPFISFSSTPSDYLSLEIKKFIEYVVAFIIILLISPILLTIAVLIKINDGGPIFFKQERVGLNGRKFKCLKFRTMVTNAEALKASLMDKNEQEGPVFKIKHDPRVTRIGNFLRKTSLDELPQFFNVLRGEMAIVGPRPPIPSEVEKYVRWQRRRLSMRPGITCIWQVSGRNNIPFEQWMKLDMQYIDNWSLRLDFVIFIKTIKVMITGDGQ